MRFPLIPVLSPTKMMEPDRKRSLKLSISQGMRVEAETAVAENQRMIRRESTCCLSKLRKLILTL